MPAETPVLRSHFCDGLLPSGTNPQCWRHLRETSIPSSQQLASPRDRNPGLVNAAILGLDRQLGFGWCYASEHEFQDRGGTPSSGKKKIVAKGRRTGMNQMWGMPHLIPTSDGATRRERGSTQSHDLQKSLQLGQAAAGNKPWRLTIPHNLGWSTMTEMLSSPKDHSALSFPREPFSCTSC